MELKNQTGAMLPLLLGKDKLPKEELLPLTLMGGSSDDPSWTLVVALLTKQKLDAIPPPPVPPDLRRVPALELIAAALERAAASVRDAEKPFVPTVRTTPAEAEREAVALERIRDAVEWFCREEGIAVPPAPPSSDRITAAHGRIALAVAAYVRKRYGTGDDATIRSFASSPQT